MAILFKTILLGQGVQIDQARADTKDSTRQPDLIIVWAGNNDSLSVPTTPPFGVVNDMTLTPLKSFEADYQSLIDKATAKYTMGPKKGFEPDVIAANVPDISAIPYLFELGKPFGTAPFTINVLNDPKLSSFLSFRLTLHSF